MFDWTTIANAINPITGGSASGSGVSLTPWQQEQLNRLSPDLQGRLGSLRRPSGSFGQTLGEVGGAPVAIDPGIDFGGRQDFGQTPDFGRADLGRTPEEWFPEVTVGGVWSPRQVDEQVNLMRAKNDAKAETEVRDQLSRMGSTGYGTNSPLAQALSANARGKAFAANTEGENTLRWDAAQGNAEHLLQSELAALTRGQSLSEDDLQRRRFQAEDDTRRLALTSDDDLRRRGLQSNDELQRLSLRTSDEAWRTRLRSEDDIARRGLAVQAQRDQSNAYVSELGALLDAINANLQPQPWSYSTSRPPMPSYSGGGPAYIQFENPGIPGSVFYG